jgi:hypothetical protein
MPGRPPSSGGPAPEALLVGRRGLLLLGTLTFLTLLPFTGKAFHIDDPMYLWAAKQIQSKPLDPYGLEVNWYGSPMRMSDVNKNPPLTSYYIAGVARVFGWGERALHLAFLIPAVVVIIGTYLLAERLCRRPLLAGFCTLLTPVFLVSSTNVMSDMLMLAFWVSAVYLWITGMMKNSAWRLLASGVLIALSALAKYYGMALIPLLFLYSLFKKRRPTWALAFLLVPICVLAAYQWATHELYGRGLLLDAASYATNLPSQWGKWSIAKLLIGLAFTGGCLGAVWVFTLWTWPRWTWLVGAAIAGTVLVTVVATHTIGGRAMRVGGENVWMAAALLGVFTTAGLGVLVLGVQNLVGRRDPESWLLGLWVLGTFAFAAGVNWTTSGRSVLPMVPAAAILIARRVEAGRRNEALNMRRTAAVGVLSAVLAVGVAWADLAYANSARVAARRIHEKYTGKTHTLRFEGHWGFQYYMEALGAKPVDVSAAYLDIGDILIVPGNNTNVYRPREDSSVLMETIEVPSSRWIATMRSDLGAGFYFDGIGPLPFAVGRVPPEQYHVFLITPQKK